MKYFVVLISFSLLSLLVTAEPLSLAEAKNNIARGEQLSEIPKEIWRQLLTKDQYDILWNSGTERPFSGALLQNTEKGVYVTSGCELPVFHSATKFKSGTGWPSFWDVYGDHVILKEEWSWVGKRVEVQSSCGEHLGHVFKDGPEPTGLRYCINSKALKFIPQAEYDKWITQKKSAD